MEPPKYNEQSFGEHMKNVAPITFNLTRDMFAEYNAPPLKKWQIIKTSRGLLTILVFGINDKIVVDVKKEGYEWHISLRQLSIFWPIRWIQIKFYKHKYRETKES